jgi:hypothetical protein
MFIICGSYMLQLLISAVWYIAAIQCMKTNVTEFNVIYKNRWKKEPSYTVDRNVN